MTTPGKIARRLLGPAFPLAGAAYRRVFVDMEKIADWMAAELGAARRVLDIGGGDGFVVNLLLERAPDLEVTMTDLARDIGSFIPEKNRSRVTLLPGADHAEAVGAFDAVTLADVIHHVPLPMRAHFLSGVAATAQRVGATKIIVKDIEPIGLRAKLSVWADRNITGDKGVALARSQDIAFEGFAQRRYELVDPPNFCAVYAPTR